MIKDEKTKVLKKAIKGEVKKAKINAKVEESAAHEKGETAREERAEQASEIKGKYKSLKK